MNKFLTPIILFVIIILLFMYLSTSIDNHTLESFPNYQQLWEEFIRWRWQQIQEQHRAADARAATDVINLANNTAKTSANTANNTSNAQRIVAFTSMSDSIIESSYNNRSLTDVREYFTGVTDSAASISNLYTLSKTALADATNALTKANTIYSSNLSQNNVTGKTTAYNSISQYASTANTARNSFYKYKADAKLAYDSVQLNSQISAQRTNESISAYNRANAITTKTDNVIQSTNDARNYSQSAYNGNQSTISKSNAAQTTYTNIQGLEPSIDKCLTDINILVSKAQSEKTAAEMQEAANIKSAADKKDAEAKAIALEKARADKEAADKKVADEKARAEKEAAERAEAARIDAENKAKAAKAAEDLRIAKEKAEAEARQLAAEKAAAEAARIKEEQRIAAAKAEAERLAKIEEARLAAIEAQRLADIETARLARIEEERLAKIEAERLAAIEAARLAKIEEERLAAIAEAKRLADIAEAKRLAEIAEAKRLADIAAAIARKKQDAVNAIVNSDGTRSNFEFDIGPPKLTYTIPQPVQQGFATLAGSTSSLLLNSGSTLKYGSYNNYSSGPVTGTGGLQNNTNEYIMSRNLTSFSPIRN